MEQKQQNPVADSPKMKDEVESATTEIGWDGTGHFYAENRTDFKGWQPSPTLKDEVHAMLDGLGKPGQLSEATIRILWPLLEELVRRRKEDTRERDAVAVESEQVREDIGKYHFIGKPLDSECFYGYHRKCHGCNCSCHNVIEAKTS